VSSRINYTNIIKNQFNSKENLRKKINKKENIYRNNMNNTIDDESLINKRNINFDFKLDIKELSLIVTLIFLILILI
jgi:hypothetical protein